MAELILITFAAAIAILFVLTGLGVIVWLVGALVWLVLAAADWHSDPWRAFGTVVVRYVAPLILAIGLLVWLTLPARERWSDGRPEASAGDTRRSGSNADAGAAP